MENEKPQRLDAFSKILLATGQINWMANSLNGVIADYRMVTSASDGKSQNLIKEFLKDKEAFMDEVVGALSKIMEDLGDYLNNGDMVSEIDIRVGKAPFDILHGKDEVERDYDGEDFELQRNFWKSND